MTKTQKEDIKIANPKEKILEYIEYKGFRKEKFFTSLGLNYGNYKGQAKKQRLNSEDLAIIISSYPELNSNWLLTGEGSMIKDEGIQSFPLRTDRPVHEEQQIPLYNLEAVAGLVPLFENAQAIQTDEYISIPNLPKCDGALFVTGDSMYPLLKSGDIVIYKQIQDFANEVFWGEMYLVSVEIAGEEYISVKYVQKSEEGKEYIKLVSQNQHHQPKDIPLCKVRAMALVKASIRINSMG